MRHLFAAYDLGKDQLYGHVRVTESRSKFLEFCRYPCSPHLTAKRCRRNGHAAEERLRDVVTGANVAGRGTRLPRWATRWCGRRSGRAPGRTRSCAGGGGPGWGTGRTRRSRC
ncbi:hypothetical protein KSE_13330 [Kitasatospora setae KM-6054]|uniref:Transposase n=1 Tax=Kitasatospora setae (strain ATCC 33774 / DSM 43861 / JCM 3304 / KCC A-0304 / NBRC 14216 / KM-6054) TaxID=452652 RepID=E4N7I1_KITSK|nr:hypothetical protein KSE_13330 [Kitasatospora setae KM-6054]